MFDGSDKQRQEFINMLQANRKHNIYWTNDLGHPQMPGIPGMLMLLTLFIFMLFGIFPFN